MSVISARIVHPIKVNLRGLSERAVIVWLNDTEKLCLRLMNGRRTWLTTQAGDSVLRRGNRETVELYRVFPASDNGLEVRSAWHWLNPGRK